MSKVETLLAENGGTARAMPAAAADNLWLKLQSAKKIIKDSGISKSGTNGFTKFGYFRLDDFMPTVIDVFDSLKLFSKISFSDELATLSIINAEKLLTSMDEVAKMMSLYAKAE